MQFITIQKISAKFSRPAPSNIDVYDVDEIAPVEAVKHMIFDPSLLTSKY